MKISIFTFLNLGLLAIIFSIFSCSNSNDGIKNSTVFESKLIARKWKLASDSNNKKHPALIIMSMHENGYFQIYDSIIDPKIISAGINKIQFISRGQYKFDGKKLVLTHFEEEIDNYKETFNVPTLTDEKLILIGKNKKINTYSAQ